MNVNIEEQYEKIYAYCYFKVNDKYIAEDITQETFYKYFNKKNYINNGKSLAILYTIAKNTCIDYYRKNKQQLQNDIENNYIYDNDIESNILLKKAIKELNEEDAEILILRFFNDLKINEISKIFNISRYSVNRKIKKALKEIKKKLNKEDFF